MKRKHFTALSLTGIFLVVTGTACTDLTPKVHDKIEDFWNTPEQIAAGVAPAYSGLRNFVNPFAIYALVETTTDEVIVISRGADWYDKGDWEKLWKHTWGPDHQYLRDTWQFIYTNIARVNSILEALDHFDPKPAGFSSIESELKTVRLYYHYVGMDLFGNVPIAEDNRAPLSALSTKPRAEVFAYIETGLKDNLANLSQDVNPITYGRATQWFAQTLLAKLYLNAEVYTGTPRWMECITACDAILNSGKYALESNFFSNFKIANDGSRENIFVIPFDKAAGLNFFWIQTMSLHYQSNFTFGLDWPGYNGFCTTAEFVNLFDSKDMRKQMFLVGQQYINQIEDPAHLQYDTDINLPLIFDPVITHFSNPDAKGKLLGARCAKWEFNKTNQGLMSNDFAVYRLADVILMKAEAQFRSGDVAAALTTINQKVNGVSIRSRAGMPDFSSSEMNLDGLLAERARELAWEGHRRNDLIRFGHFTDARIPEKEISENFRILYPIPQAELDKNPNLKQNPGY